ncbi:hypothetical protein L7H23_08860 [Sphingopyxis sp. BSN-002]|jgi:hypothetical protein|nr:hypothetical protein [Sphingopyxis sp. BSN-002]UKK86187.1 hypothetical protein L7H23_08860 [Sphingopyxis sp. BSN-002]
MLRHAAMAAKSLRADCAAFGYDPSRKARPNAFKPDAGITVLDGKSGEES